MRDVIKRPIFVASVGGFILILIGVWIMFLPGRKPRLSLPVTSHGAAESTVARTPRHDVPAATASVRPTAVGELWTRPSAKVAARNLRLTGFVMTLRRLGASDAIAKRLADGDIRGVVTELKRQAEHGDRAAANMLAYMSGLPCRFAKGNQDISGFQAAQLRDAQALPAQDAEFLNTVTYERVAYNKEFASVCDQDIDSKAVNDLVTKSAAQGDGASLWVLGFTRDKEIRQQRTDEAAAAGFAIAQYELATGITSGFWQAVGGSVPTEDAGDLLRAAAVDLPNAESQLAICEFTGCPGIPPDIPSAVSHAREAAQRGSIDAMLQIGPQLPQSQIDPDEVSAWSLLDAALEQQGCAGMGFSVGLIKSISATLNSPTITINTRNLANEYWQEYGEQMLAQLGCSSTASAASGAL